MDESKRTFDIVYIDPDGKFDETEFDIVNAPVDKMMSEIVTLFNAFCEETYHVHFCELHEISEVPYDGGKEE